VVKARIRPVKLPEGGEAPSVLAELERVLSDAPPPWLAKVMGLSPEDGARFVAAGS